MSKNPQASLTISVALILVTLSHFSAAKAQTAVSLGQQKKAREVFMLTSALYLEDKDRAKAREGYLQAIKLYPGYPQPRYNLAVFAEADENWDEAVRWFTEFLRFDAKSPYADKARTEIARLNRIRIQDSTPEGKKKRQYEEAIFKARGLANMGLAKEAVAEAAQAVKIDRARWEAYAVTANVLSSQELYVEAATFLQQAIDRAPANKTASLQRVLDDYPKERQYHSLGRAGAQALKAGKYREAAANFISAWRLFPNRDEYGIDAAVAYAIAGDKAKAEALLTMLEQDATPTTAKKVIEIRSKLSKQ
jgi:tetratricopeptide (TPR) repeat protein